MFEHRKVTHPERLLASEIRMAAPSPQPAGAEAASGVLFRPVDACSGPLARFMHSRTLVVLVSILLVVRDELERESEDAQPCEDIVGCGEMPLRWWEDCGVVSGEGKHKKEDVLGYS